MDKSLENVLSEIPESELIEQIQQITELAKFFGKWINNSSKKGAGASVAGALLKHCKKYDDNQVKTNSLDILNVTLHEENYEWQVYEFTEPADYFEEINDPNIFMTRLLRKLTLGFKGSAHYIMKNGLIRFCARVENPIRLSNVTTLHAAFSMHTSIIVGHFSNDQEKDTILTALTSALMYHKYRELSLKGRCVRSLMQLYLDINNPHYRKKFPKFNPLLTLTTTEQENSFTQLPPSKERELDEYLENVFGSFQQPRLQRVQFNLQTSFDKSNELYDWRVSFNGPSVLEGIREMVAKGVVNPPLPKYVENIRISGQDVFNLRSST